MTHTRRERERERERERDFDLHFQKKKPKSKLWIGIVLGGVALAGTGTAIYFATRSKKSETISQTVEQKVSQLQSQLAQIENFLTTLNQNITQTENSLNTKRDEQTQNPQNNSLQTEKEKTPPSTLPITGIEFIIFPPIPAAEASLEPTLPTVSKAFFPSPVDFIILTTVFPPFLRPPFIELLT